MEISKNKSIIFLEDSSQSSYGGGQRITEEICQSLKNQFNLIVIDSIDSVLIKNLTKKIPNISTKNINLVPSKTILFNINLILKSFLIVKYFNKNNFLYITTRKHLITGILIKIFFPKIKIYYHYHLCSPKGILWFFYDLLTFLISENIIFASNYLYEDFKSKRKIPNIIIKNSKIHISPYPTAKWNINDLMLEKYIPINPFTIAYIGKLSNEKGIIIFLESLKLLPNSFKWLAIIAGNGELKERVSEFIKKTKWNGEVFYLGSIETNFDFYKTLSLVIVPSFKFIETIGLTALEAIQAGIPVITSSTGNLKNFVKDGLSISVEENPIQISELIIYIYNKLKKDNSRKINHSNNNDFKYFYEKILSKN